jgi:hypothetical protein
MSPVALLFVLVLLFLVPLVFGWLWNMTCPDVFGLPKITYWQAFRLLILAAFLFGGAHFATQSNGSWTFGF